MAFARTTDPQTSHDAAASVGNISKVQHAILQILNGRGMHDENMIAQYRMWQELGSDLYPQATDQSIRSRRAELVKLGLVKACPMKEKMSTGRLATVWIRA